MFLQSDENFKCFFDAFYPRLVSFSRKYIKDEEKARDVVQDAFLRLYENRTSFESEIKTKAFLYKTSRNICFDLLKHRSVEEKYLRITACDPNEDEQFVRDVICEEVIDTLHCAISKLPTQSRRIISAALEGKKNAEIAEILNIAESSVKTLRKNAYMKLREMLPRDIMLLFYLIFKKR